MAGNFKVHSSKATYMDLRDDRVYLYFDLYKYYYHYNYYNDDWEYISRNGNDYGEEDNEDGTYGNNYFNYDKKTDAYSLVFRIALNASYTGKYYLPSPYVETMYDKGVNASVPGKWVTVVK